MFYFVHAGILEFTKDKMIVEKLNELFMLKQSWNPDHQLSQQGFFVGHAVNESWHEETTESWNGNQV